MQFISASAQGPYKKNKRTSKDEKLKEHLPKLDQTQLSLVPDDLDIQAFQRSEEMVKLFKKINKLLKWKKINMNAVKAVK